MRRVNMYVDQPSCIELHVRETVRIDRLQPTAADGYVAEQHGALLAPGVTQLQLDKGLYHFRTLDDAQLRVLAGGVQVASMSAVARTHGPAGSNPTARRRGRWEAVDREGMVPAAASPPCALSTTRRARPRSARAIHTGAEARA